MNSRQARITALAVYFAGPIFLWAHHAAAIGLEPIIFGGYTEVTGQLDHTSGSAAGYEEHFFGERVEVTRERDGVGYHAFAVAEDGRLKASSRADGGGFQNGSYASAHADWFDYFIITGNDATESFVSGSQYTPCGALWCEVPVYEERYIQDWATVVSHIDGTVAGRSPVGGASFSFTVLYEPASWCVYSCDTAEDFQLLADEERFVTGQSRVDVNTTFSTDFAFRYNTPFMITATLSTEAADGGLSDFANTGSFGLILPSGAQLESASGLLYGTPAPIPEPATYATLMVGLALLGLLSRASTGVGIPFRPPPAARSVIHPGSADGKVAPDVCSG